MRKLMMFNLMSLDGYVEGPKGDITWHNVDAEFNGYAVAMLNSTGTLLFGRVTYELMAGFWPTAQARRDDPVVAELMNGLPKVVFSRTSKSAHWNNTRLVNSNMEGEVSHLKEQPGKDVVLLGSGMITAQLSRAGLIDEYCIMLNPLVLGAGTPLLKGLGRRLDLQLQYARTFQNGNVLLCYQPAGKET